jgi:predicted phage terminase large subunit-like protein
VILPVAVEAFGAFQAIPQMLREQAPGLRLLELGGDPKDPKAKLYRSNKFTRAQPASRAWKAKRIRVPHNAAWTHPWIQEHNDFTGLGDVHDDQVDTTSHGFNRLYQEAPRSSGGRTEEGNDF